MLLVIVGDGDIPANEAEAILNDQAEALATEGDELGGIVFGATAEEPSDGLSAIYNWATEQGVAFDAIGPFAELFSGAAYAEVTDGDTDPYEALLGYLGSLAEDGWTMKVLALFTDTKAQADEDAGVEAFCGAAMEAGMEAFMMNGQMFQFGSEPEPEPAPAPKKLGGAKKLGAAKAPEPEPEPEEAASDEEEGWTKPALMAESLADLKTLANEYSIPLTNVRKKETVVDEMLAWQAERAGAAAEEAGGSLHVADEDDARAELKALIKEAFAEVLAEMAGAVLA